MEDPYFKLQFKNIDDDFDSKFLEEIIISYVLRKNLPNNLIKNPIQDVWILLHLLALNLTTNIDESMEMHNMNNYSCAEKYCIDIIGFCLSEIFCSGKFCYSLSDHHHLQLQLQLIYNLTFTFFLIY